MMWSIRRAEIADSAIALRVNGYIKIKIVLFGSKHKAASTNVRVLPGTHLYLIQITIRKAKGATMFVYSASDEDLFNFKY